VGARFLLISSLCLILAIVRMAGTHAHLEHSHAGASGTHHVVMVDEDSPLHLMSHLVHGDIDADDSVQSVAKVFVLAAIYAPALVLLVLVSLLAPTLRLHLWRERPELRPPAQRCAFELSPPSHAPPVAP
jgi:hypothetical protein